MVGHSVNVVGPVKGTTIWLRLDADVTFSAHFKFQDLETKVLKGGISDGSFRGCRGRSTARSPIMIRGGPSDEGEW